VPHPIENGVVIRSRNAEELNPVVAQLGHRIDDVVGRNCDVLTTGSLIELEILVDLGFLFPFRGLVERELDAAVAIGDDLRHQG